MYEIIKSDFRLILMQLVFYIDRVMVMTAHIVFSLCLACNKVIFNT